MDLLTDILGMDVKFAEWGKEKTLPFYLSDGYDFQKVEIEGCFCIFISSKKELPTLPALKKQIQRIQKAEALPVVVCVKSMSTFRRKNMIKNKIPFIIEGKQAYLPFMGTFLQKHTEEGRMIPEKFQISSQVLLLMYLYQKKEELYLADAVKRLPYSAMTITRAAKQLVASGLFCVKKEGVNKILFSNDSKQNLYEHSKEFLNSPVMKTGYVYKTELGKTALLTGASALSAKTMLSGGILLEYAIDKKDIRAEELNQELIDPHEQVKIEVWKYPPYLFGTSSSVDPISLALSLRNEKDERIEGAVEEILEQLWRKIDGHRA